MISALGSFLWGWPMIILLVGTHLYLTVRLKFPQRKIFKAIKLSVQRESGSTGDISPLGALMTSLAATVGTGNIIGVATAVSLGGPGAVFWCWLTGVLGIATKYAEGLLAVKYRVKTDRGDMIGGPMYALRNGLNMKVLATLFCVFTAMASFGIGNMVQSNSIAMLAKEACGLSPHVTGVAIAIMVALVVFFGIRGIARTCTFLVPFMAIFYVVGCVLILIINYKYLDDSIVLIFKSAFSPQAAGGGFVGSSVMMAARFGIARGLFSNESGMGSAPIIAAAAKTRNPVRQALVSASGTFWDTVVICALTGLVVVSSIIAYPDIDTTQGAALTHAAFCKLPYAGTIVLTVGLFSFTFSTILGWSYYGEKSIEYLVGGRWVFAYRVLWIVAIYVGAVANLGLVWNFSDCMNAMMAIPNLISLLLLSGVVAAETNKYLWSGRLDEEEKDE
ncbi:MAG: sodium:alanine symporter family protein [Paludibacteraceae bacterium]